MKWLLICVLGALSLAAPVSATTVGLSLLPMKLGWIKEKPGGMRVLSTLAIAWPIGAIAGIMIGAAIARWLAAGGAGEMSRLLLELQIGLLGVEIAAIPAYIKGRQWVEDRKLVSYANSMGHRRTVRERARLEKRWTLLLIVLPLAGVGGAFAYGLARWLTAGVVM